MGKQKVCDLIIIGAGAAGLASAIYAARREINTMLVSKDVGGQMAWTNEIENYPGFDFITGPELIGKMEAQAEKYGAQFLTDEVTSIAKIEGGFLVKADKERFNTKAVILSFGLTPKNLGVPGEKELRGKGISYCATCDGPLYKGKTVVIVGGGNSGFEAAEYLSKIAKRVYLVHINEEFTASPYLIKRMDRVKNVEYRVSSSVVEIKGKSIVKSVTLENKKTSKTETLKTDGVFIEIGYEAKTQWLKGFLKLNKRGEIITNEKCQTSRAGVFAAGDCTDTPYKQIVISGGEGAKAALQAYDYISKSTSLVVVPDWGKK
jgi:thioredoxin-disulfide reductase